MSSLAIAILLASLVGKEILQPKRAALAGAACSIVFHIVFGEQPVPALLATPVYCGLHWLSLIAIQRARLLLLPVAILTVLGAVIGSEVTRSWVEKTFPSLLILTDEQREALEQLKTLDAGTPMP